MLRDTRSRIGRAIRRPVAADAKASAFRPDPALYPECDEALKAAMFTETELFFASIVVEDRSVLSFLDADYTFVNERLARHYGMTGVLGETFRRVSLEHTPRGGVITMASVLAATSNPTRTSPVKRGRWILENILGSPPPPPPEGVEAAPGNREARRHAHAAAKDGAASRQPPPVPPVTGGWTHLALRLKTLTCWEASGTRTAGRASIRAAGCRAAGPSAGLMGSSLHSGRAQMRSPGVWPRRCSPMPSVAQSGKRTGVRSSRSSAGLRGVNTAFPRWCSASSRASRS